MHPTAVLLVEEAGHHQVVEDFQEADPHHQEADTAFNADNFENVQFTHKPTFFGVRVMI